MKKFSSDDLLKKKVRKKRSIQPGATVTDSDDRKREFEKRNFQRWTQVIVMIDREQRNQWERKSKNIGIRFCWSSQLSMSTLVTNHLLSFCSKCFESAVYQRMMSVELKRSYRILPFVFFISEQLTFSFQPFSVLYKRLIFVEVIRKFEKFEFVLLNVLHNLHRTFFIVSIFWEN